MVGRKGQTFFTETAGSQALVNQKNCIMAPKVINLAWLGLADDEDLNWITLTPKDCLDTALRDLDQAFKRFFDGLKKGTGEGFPSFRSADRNNSISFKAFERRIIDGASVAKPKVVFG